MNIEQRMHSVLEKIESEDHVSPEEAKKIASEEKRAGDLAGSQDLNTRAAQILAAGLRSDLPDDQDAAMDYLMDVLKTLVKQKQYLSKALRFTSSPGQVRAVLQKLQNGVK